MCDKEIDLLIANNAKGEEEKNYSSTETKIHVNMENGTPSPSSVKGNFIQLGLCIIISIAQLSAGMSMGFSAVTLPYMQKEISYINVTSDQASWIAGLAAITIPIGCLISGPILDRWGRKTGLLIVNLPAFIGWLLIAVQPNLSRLYIGRALTGLAGGLASVPATVYFAEIATKSMRGFLINGTSIAIAIGVLIVYILGYYLKEDWRMVASICAVFPLSATILIAMLVPESPIWLVSKGRNKRAYSALQVIRGVSDKLNVQEEINTIVNQNNLNRKNKLTLKETLNLFTCPEVYKPLFIMIMFFFFQQFSGIFVIIFYAVDIAQQSGINMDPYVVSMAIALMRVIFTLFAAWFTKKVGRRPPAILSGFGMTISLFVLIFYLNSANDSPPKLNSFDNKTDLNNSHSINNSLIDLHDNDLRPISWVPLSAILLYVIFSTIGFLTLPWSMIGEVFPSQVRGVGGGVSTCFAYIASFITVKSYPLLSSTLHQSGVYTIFGIMAFIGTLFVIFLLPETQGKTLQEIEQYFKTGGKKRSQNKNDSQENKIMLSTVTKPVIQTKS